MIKQIFVLFFLSLFFSPFTFICICISFFVGVFYDVYNRFNHARFTYDICSDVFSSTCKASKKESTEKINVLNKKMERKRKIQTNRYQYHFPSLNRMNCKSYMMWIYSKRSESNIIIPVLKSITKKHCWVAVCVCVSTKKQKRCENECKNTFPKEIQLYCMHMHISSMKAREKKSWQ